ncbi:MAG: hypothetical protein QN183_02875 [Armatimonadota bacterium]|nr:hypothetical protein [Armatimonadota bacterium]MDR7532368.1 hypothetical protein [Armatimonadota bacterium]MDR7535295.1 hypothetical protein [Armatimonadota bacterium]
MPSGREELRRGVRNLIETASRELEALAAPPSPPVLEQPVVPAVASRGGGAEAPARDARPILRLVRDPESAGATPGAPVVPGPGPGAELPATRRGVCAAYYVNRRCWEVPEAYCNTALHVCMLRECPVYHLNRDELEQRFARKFSHLW